MTTSSQGRADRLQWNKNGSILVIPSSTIDLATGAAAQDHFLVPWKAYVVAAYANIIAPPGTAAATIFAGQTDDTDAIVDDYSVATTHATGLLELTITTATIEAGDIIVFGSDGGGTSTGSAIMSLVAVPYNSVN